MPELPGVNITPKGKNKVCIVPLSGRPRVHTIEHYPLIYQNHSAYGSTLLTSRTSSQCRRQRTRKLESKARQLLSSGHFQIKYMFVLFKINISTEYKPITSCNRDPEERAGFKNLVILSLLRALTDEEASIMQSYKNTSNDF